MAEPRHQHRSDLHAAAPRPARRGGSQGLRVMVGLPWSQHVAFLDDRSLKRDDPPRARRRRCARLGDHPAVLTFRARQRDPARRRPLARADARRALPARACTKTRKRASPDSLFTYVNFPPTEFLDLSFFDICAFNVYLHREAELRAYLARLQHIAGQKPLLLAEAGADSIREGEDGQAAITAMHVRAAFEEGACGAIAFAWTDEWWRGGYAGRRLDVRPRRPRAPPEARGRRGRRGVRGRAVPARARARLAPRVGRRLRLQRRRHARRLPAVARAADLSRLRDHPRQRRLARSHRARSPAAIARVRVIDTPNGGLSAARNVGLAAATGEIVAYTDADTRVDPRLADVPRPAVPHARTSSAPADRTSCPPTIRRWRSASRARPAARRTCCSTIASPSTCPAATWRSAATRCWRSAASTPSTCAPATMWTCAGGCRRAAGRSASRRRRSCGTTTARRSRRTGGSRSATAKAKRWLMAHHPDKFLDGRMLWRGRIYSPLPFVRSLWGTRINAGVWGTAAFPSVYRTDVHPFAFLPHSIKWQVVSFVPDRSPAAWSRRPASTRGRRRCCSAPASSASRRRSRRTSPTRCARTSTRCPAGGSGTAAIVAYLHFIQPLARVARPHPRRAVAAGSRAAADRAADEPRAAAVAGRGLARAAAHLAAA